MINGCNCWLGDLFVLGMISGLFFDFYGSMLELVWCGEWFIMFGNGEYCMMLEDGDWIMMIGWV